uniref:Uncharacterized protein n=1 Tax=Plectus sambesii TaxID=2011161 RepID=A0A914VFR1_9BILA
MMTQIVDESFALEPLDASLVVQQGLEKHIRPKRKRRLIVDEQKNISGEEMKSNMSEWRDTTTPLDLAPPTKKLMHLRESGSVDKLFQNPGCSALRAKSIVK